jgi:hypothetical protein
MNRRKRQLKLQILGFQSKIRKIKRHIVWLNSRNTKYPDEIEKRVEYWNSRITSIRRDLKIKRKILKTE